MYKCKALSLDWCRAREIFPVDTSGTVIAEEKDHKTSCLFWSVLFQRKFRQSRTRVSSPLIECLEKYQADYWATGSNCHNQAVLINYRPQANVCVLSLSLYLSLPLFLFPPTQWSLWHIVHQSYFSSRPQLLNKWGRWCDPIEYRGKLIAFITSELLMRKPLTRACFVSWLLASSQCVCLLGRLYSGWQSWAIGRRQYEETQTS